MSNPDRLQREAQEHAEVLIEDRGPVNALAWAIHCANRSTDGFWSARASSTCEMVRQQRQSGARRGDDESDPKADRGDWEFHRSHDQ